MGTLTGYKSDGSVKLFDVTDLGTVITLMQNTVQTPTEAVLVSGIDNRLGGIINVTLTAARLVGAPTNGGTGQRLTFEFIQGGAGGFAVTWNAAFRKIWSDVGNTTGKITTISFFSDGAQWVQDGGQALYM